MELLIFAHDHSLDKTIPGVNLAALPALYDLVTWQADGWSWGTEELANPLFRIISWPGALAADLDPLLAEQQASGGTLGTPQFLWQYRAFHLNLAPTNVALPLALTTGLADVTRTAQILAIPAVSPLTVSGLRIARPPVPNPVFIGVNPAVIG